MKYNATHAMQIVKSSHIMGHGPSYDFSVRMSSRIPVHHHNSYTKMKYNATHAMTDCQVLSGIACCSKLSGSAIITLSKYLSGSAPTVLLVQNWLSFVGCWPDTLIIDIQCRLSWFLLALRLFAQTSGGGSPHKSEGVLTSRSSQDEDDVGWE